MKLKEQDLMIQRLLSSNDTFTRCVAIIKHDYFEETLKPIVKFIIDYYEKYHALPDVDAVNAKFNKEYKKEYLTKDMIASLSDNVEQFCKQSAITKAIFESLEEVERGEFGKLVERFQQATSISLVKDMGVDMFDDPENYIKTLLEDSVYYPTGIQALDSHLDGGLARQQVTLFSANSGGGKSVMLSNLACNYACSGMDVLLISLELSEKMIYLRNSYILSGVNSKKWKENLGKIISTIVEKKSNGAGSLTIKRLPGAATCNDIRAYLKQYELEKGTKPDVIVLDYLDQLQPNGGVKNIPGYEQDKQKAEQFYEICYNYNAIGITASQQNRGALENDAPTQAVIAGGLTKVNTVDNYISLFMSPEMRIKNEMAIYFLKTRSSDGVGKSGLVRFDTHNLRITNLNEKEVDISVMIKVRKQMEKQFIEDGLLTADEVVNINKELENVDNSSSMTNLEKFMAENLADGSDLVRPIFKNEKTNIDEMQKYMEFI